MIMKCSFTTSSLRTIGHGLNGIEDPLGKSPKHTGDLVGNVYRVKEKFWENKVSIFQIVLLYSVSIAHCVSRCFELVNNAYNEQCEEEKFTRKSFKQIGNNESHQA
jgi:hypothetical protein